MADNAALSHAVSLGAADLRAAGGLTCAPKQRPTSALGVAVQALTLLIEQRLVMEVAQFSPQAGIKVIPPPFPLTVSSIDFGHAGEFVERARHATGRWIDEGGPLFPNPERFLSLYDHTHPLPRRQSVHA